MSLKRPSSDEGALTKRSRVEDEVDETSNMTVIATRGTGPADAGALTRAVPRTSSLSAPILSLSGAHVPGSTLTSTVFSPSGSLIAAAGTDKSISIWNSYPKHENIALLKGITKSAILDVAFSKVESNQGVWSVDASGYLTLSSYKTGERIRRYYAHDGVINSLSVTLLPGSTTRELVVTGGDDGVVRVWDPEKEGKEPVVELGDGSCPTTAVAWNSEGNGVWVGGLDNEIHLWDIQKKIILYSLQGHTDTIASIAPSPPGSPPYLLSFSLASTMIIHSTSPFSSNPTRIHKTLYGAPPCGFENVLTKCAWSLHDNGRRVAVGGSDRSVVVWDTESGEILYKLPGHKGTVTAVAFHPKEPILLTSSKDGSLILGELA